MVLVANCRCLKISLWLTNRLQRVILLMALHLSKWESGVPQSSAYMNGIGFGVSSTLRLFADDCILYCVTDSPRGTKILQQGLNLIIEWCKR